MTQANKIEDLIREGFRVYKLSDLPTMIQFPLNLYHIIYKELNIVAVIDKKE